MSLMRLSSLFDVIKSRFSGIYDRKTAFSCHKPSKKPGLLHQINIIPSRITSGAAILLLLNRKMPRIIFCARGISAVGAHHTGSVGVTGSSPVCSTNKKPLNRKGLGGLLFAVKFLRMMLLILTLKKISAWTDYINKLSSLK